MSRSKPFGSFRFVKQSPRRAAQKAPGFGFGRTLRVEGLEERRLLSVSQLEWIRPFGGVPNGTFEPADDCSVATADDPANVYLEIDGTDTIPGENNAILSDSFAANIAPPPISTPAKVGNEFRVNTTTALDQRFWEPSPEAVAMDADGDFVVTWSSQAQDGDGWGVFAQRYSASGAAAGGEFQVNTTTLGNQQYSTVAVDPDGDFVITWSTLANEVDNLGVYARRYNAAGVPQGEEFLVEPINPSYQRLSVAAMDAQGNTLIAWSELEPSGGDQAASNVRARLFNADGVALGPSFQVNTTTDDLQRQASVARNGKGQFVIVWRSRGQDGDSDGVFGRVYAADGTALTGELQINEFTAGQQIRATVAMDSAGNFVVTWYNQLPGDDAGSIVPRDIFARRFAADGTPLGGEFRVNTTSAGQQRYPSVDMDQDGDFAITWASLPQDGSDWGVYVQAFEATGAKIGPELRVNTTTANRQIYPDVAMDDDGDFVVAWSSLTQDGDGYGIYAQRYTQPQGFAYPQVTGVYVPRDDHAIDEGERIVQQPLQLIVSFSESMRIGLGADSVTNKANWQLTRNGIDVSPSISVIAFQLNAETNRYEARITFSAALTEGSYVLRAQSAIRDANGFNLDGNYNGVGGGSFARAFDVLLPTLTGDEFRVNTTTAGDQLFAPSAPGTVAIDDAGNFVVVWSSAGQDGSGQGVYAQRFDAAGTPLGGEFRVNTFTSGHQRLATVAMAADGDFVVTWTSASQDGSNDGVYAQLYFADGSPLGSEFRVNATTNNAQARSSVAMDEAGNFVVAWESVGQDGAGPGIYYQRFAADGTKLGGESRANTFTTDAQRLPHVALDTDGDFVITWSSNIQDGSGYGVYARRFNTAGMPLGGEFRVNQATAGNQMSSAVAMDADGDFAIAFQSDASTGSSDEVYFQLYSAAGAPLGNNQQVNAITANSQSNPSVAIDDDGDLVVTWQSLNQDGSAWGVYARRFGWNGTPHAGEFRVNTRTLSNQLNANVATDADGDFVIAWTSQLQDGSGQGIYAQRFQAFVNTPPVAAAGGPYQISEGGSLFLNGSGSFDPDAGQTLNYSWDVNNDGVFGDATGASPTLTWSQLNAWGVRDDGTREVRIRVTDSFGASTDDAATLTVLDVAPHTVIVAPPAGVFEDGTATLQGVFTDPGTLDSHEAIVNWGDGTIQTIALPIGARSFSLNHKYADDNPTGTSSDQYPITVTVSSDGASSAPTGTVVTVANVAPQVSTLTTSMSTVVEGSTLTVTGTFTDAGALDIHALLVSWGDGTASTGIVNEAARTFSATHVYGDEEPTSRPTITVTLTDDDGGAAAAQTSVNVQNAVPQVAGLQLSSTTINEGGAVTVTGSYSDSGTLDTHTVLIGWGDGAATIANINQALRTFTATHTYLDDNPTGTSADQYAINVTVSDDDNGVGAGQSSVTVQNVAPSNLQLDPLEADLEGSEVTLTGRFTDAGSLDTHRVLLNWADGATQEIQLPAGVREFSVNHTYLDDNNGTPYSVNVTLVDDDGGSTSASRNISISNANPTIANVDVFPLTIAEGAATGVTGSIDDLGTLDTHTVVVDWGDGSSSNAFVDLPTRTYIATHQYLDDNPSGTASDVYPISVTVTDDDGGVDVAGASVTVANLAPTVSITAIPIVINIGQPFTLQALAEDASPLDTITFQWLVTRNGQTVAAGAGDSFAFTPLQLGVYVFTLTGTDDDGGVGAAQIALEAGPCQLPGDTNGDCSVDLVDLNNVRNHFGETGLGAVDLSFNAPVPGSITDKDGLGTGFTHRLPGTGSALPVNDPNLDLEPGAGGRLRIRSTTGSIGGPGEIDNPTTAEALGVLVENVAGADLEVSALFLNVQVPAAFDQLYLYVGLNDQVNVRAGFRASNQYALIRHTEGGDDEGLATPSNAFQSGDNVRITLSRTSGDWRIDWDNLSRPGANGSLEGLQLSELDVASSLYIGIVHSSPVLANGQTAVVESFTIDIRRPVLGDANGDFVVDLTDLNAVRNNFGASVGAPVESGYRQAADAVFAQWTAERALQFHMEPEALAPGGNRALKHRKH